MVWVFVTATAVAYGGVMKYVMSRVMNPEAPHNTKKMI